MIDTAAVLVTFGPIVDRLFVLALVLIIFVYGVTAVMWVLTEVTKLIKRIRKIDTETEELDLTPLATEPVNSVLYEVMWGVSPNDTYASETRRRIVADPMVGARDLITENGSGHIRYRAWLSEPESWGTAAYYTENDALLFPPEKEVLSNRAVAIALGKHSSTTVKAEDGDPV